MAHAQTKGQKSTIGEKLRNTREAKGLSLEEVHVRLRIHSGILQKLEENDFSSLSGGLIYAKGFLKQYAGYLGLNTSEILAEFSHLGIQGPPVELFVGNTRKHETERETNNVKRKPTDWIAMYRNTRRRFWRAIRGIRQHREKIRKFVFVGAIVLVALAMAIFTLRSVEGWYQNMKSRYQKITKAVPPVKKRPLVIPARPAEAKTAKTPDASPPLVQAVGPAALQNPPLQQQKSAELSNEDSKYLNSPGQNNYPRIGAETPISLRIDAIKDVWMRVAVDGEVTFETILKIDESKTWKAKDSLRLKLGRPEAAVFTVNGFNIGKAGKGKIREVRLTREGMEAL